MTHVLIIVSHIILLSELLHWPYIFKVSLRSYGTWVVLSWISLIVLWLLHISLWTLTCGWLCGQLCITNTLMSWHCYRGFAVVAGLTDKLRLFIDLLLVRVPCENFRRTMVDALVSSLRSCFELIEILWLRTYLRHLDFVSTTICWTNGKRLLLRICDICWTWVDRLMLLRCCSLWQNRSTSTKAVLLTILILTGELGNILLTNWLTYMIQLTILFTCSALSICRWCSNLSRSFLLCTSCSCI